MGYEKDLFEQTKRVYTSRTLNCIGHYWNLGTCGLTQSYAHDIKGQEYGGKASIEAYPYPRGDSFYALLSI